MPRSAAQVQTAACVVPLPRRGLRLEQAALYIGVSPTTFLQLVADKQMPVPSRLRGCVLWDIRQLDIALDAVFGKPMEEADHWSTPIA